MATSGQRREWTGDAGMLRLHEFLLRTASRQLRTLYRGSWGDLRRQRLRPLYAHQDGYADYHTDTNRNGYPDRDGDEHLDSHPNGYPNADADHHSHQDPHGNANHHPHSHSDRNGDEHPDSHGNQYSSADADHHSHRNPHGNADRHRHADRDGHRNGDALSDPIPQLDKYRYRNGHAGR